MFDHRTDTPVEQRSARAGDDAVLIFDGVFLLRPELRSHWDFVVLLDTSHEEVLRRAVERDGELFGGETVVTRRYREKYLPAYDLYVTSVRPEIHAAVIIDTSDVLKPRIIEWRPGETTTSASQRSVR